MNDIQPHEDGRFTPVVGSWSKAKHHYLRRYIDIFTVGMKYKVWTLHYIDLFAGTGIVRIKNTRELDWGSPLIAARARERFTRLHLCESSEECFNALQARLNEFSHIEPPQILMGDAAKQVDEVMSTIPPRRTLSLAFLDPFGLHLQFDTLRALADAGRKVDMIIFFPDHLDALRNWNIYLNKTSPNLDLVLDTDEWRTIPDRWPRDKWAEQLADLYKNQIRMLGYKHFDSIRIKREDGRFLYKLIFCSRHKTGGQFWTKISGIERDGQWQLFS